MTKQVKLGSLLPEYPATLHIPWKPNTKGDRIASEQEASAMFSSDRVLVQEKIDGANCGMALVDGHPVIRSRSKILRKASLTGGANPSMSQFAPAFTWFYKNKEKFQKLLNLVGNMTVYGEWMVQQHGMVYDRLPDWFIAYDLYDQDMGRYVDGNMASTALTLAGFSTIPTLHFGNVESYQQLEELANGETVYAEGKKREGVYVKVGDGEWTTHRFKMVRQGFQQGCLLGDEIKRNELKK